MSKAFSIASVVAALASLAFFGLSVYFSYNIFTEFSVQSLFGAFFAGIAGFFLMSGIEHYGDEEMQWRCDVLLLLKYEEGSDDGETATGGE
jgi:hypothetical protein